MMPAAAAGPVAGPALALGDALRARGVALRSETEADQDFLCRLYVSVRWEELLPLADWSDLQKLDFLSQQFAAQTAHYRNAYGGSEFAIIERHGQPIGRIYLFRGRHDIRIIDISLMPEARGQGLGTLILQAVFAEAVAAGGKTVSIHVEVYNPAQRLYQRLGFTRIGESGPYHLMEWRPPA